MLKINLEDDFEQKVFLSGMRCALGFPNIKSSFSTTKKNNKFSYEVKTSFQFKIFPFLFSLIKILGEVCQPEQHFLDFEAWSMFFSGGDTPVDEIEAQRPQL